MARARASGRHGAERPAARVAVHRRRHPDPGRPTAQTPGSPRPAIRPSGEREAEAGRFRGTRTVPSLTLALRPACQPPAPRIHGHVLRTRHLPTPASLLASPLLTWTLAAGERGPPPAPPGFTRGHSFPPETPTKAPQGLQVTREGGAGRRGLDDEISFFSFFCSFDKDPVVLLSQRTNKHFRVEVVRIGYP